MNRLAIYFFWDRDGIVDDYVPYFLNSIRPFCEEICVVVNGFLTPESTKKIESCANKILLRENTGLDAYAYKYAIEDYGYEQIKKYDELILTNFTFFGPFYPLNEMFNDMDKKNGDWWGPFRWPTKKPVNYHHIPSFFVVYRQSLLKSPLFQKYWETLPSINNYEESVHYHEQRQTPYFDEAGFEAATWIDAKKYEKFWDTGMWPLECADSLIIEDKFPFIKRRVFYVENKTMYFSNQVKEIVPFIKSHTSYDAPLILNNIQRTQNLDALDEDRKPLKWAIWAMLHPLPRKRQRYKHKLSSMKKREFLKLFLVS